jgi:hypothetical protein
MNLNEYLKTQGQDVKSRILSMLYQEKSADTAVDTAVDVGVDTTVKRQVSVRTVELKSIDTAEIEQEEVQASCSDSVVTLDRHDSIYNTKFTPKSETYSSYILNPNQASRNLYSLQKPTPDSVHYTNNTANTTTRSDRSLSLDNESLTTLQRAPKRSFFYKLRKRLRKFFRRKVKRLFKH